MYARWLCLPLVLVLAMPIAGGEKKTEPSTPTVVVRVRSLDAIVDNFKLVAGLVGREEIARQVQGLIKSKIGPQGLEGIDTSRPIAVYGRIADNFNDLAGVAVLPIRDEKTFLTLLDNLGLDPRKNGEGVYTVTVPRIGIEAHFRFAHRYVYASALSAASLAPAKLLAPERIFPAGQAALFSATLHLDQVPEVAKRLALSNLEDQLQQASKKQPGETDNQFAVRQEFQKEFLQRVKTVMEQGRELAVELDLKPKTKEFVANLTLTADAKSDLAKLIAGVGQAKSVFGGIKSEQAVIDGRLHVVLPPAIAKALEKAIAEDTAGAVASITDAGKRKQAEALVQTLLASFKSGEIDAIVQLAAQDKHFNLVAGVKIEDGAQLGTLVHDLAADLLKDVPPAEAAKVKLNAESVNGVKIHRIDVQQVLDAKARELFGDNPLYVAFRADAVLLAVGEGGLEALKAAITASAAVSPALRVDVALARLAPLLAKTEEQRALVGKLFTVENPGRVRLTLEGGSSVRVQFASDLSVVQFFTTFVPRGKLGLR
jgi:hypothetical protein